MFCMCVCICFVYVLYRCFVYAFFMLCFCMCFCICCVYGLICFVCVVSVFVSVLYTLCICVESVLSQNDPPIMQKASPKSPQHDTKITPICLPGRDLILLPTFRAPTPACQDIIRGAGNYMNLYGFAMLGAGSYINLYGLVTFYMNLI